MTRSQIALLLLGLVLAIIGAGLAVIPAGIGTLYWIGWGVLLVGVLCIVGAAESAS